jgi:glycosyltransferase involved in cell wall biosynthesis
MAHYTPKIVFVSDFYPEDITGGAELTLQALIDECPYEYEKIRSNQINQDFAIKNIRSHWVFGNFASAHPNLLAFVAGNIRYSIVEFDYKFCKYRSLDKHLETESSECNCHQTELGAFMQQFYKNANSIFWMSERQRDITHERMPALRETNNVVLGSVFNRSTLDKLYKLSGQEKKGYSCILDADSWVKGTNNALSYCQENNIEPVKIKHSYSETLALLSEADTLIYLPAGADTCPRLVIEAKILGCNLVLNDNVQHKDETWFSSRDSIIEHLESRSDFFWSKVGEVNFSKRLSGYTTTYNAVDQGYPFVECITNMLDFCDEVVVVDGDSNDGTLEILQDMAQENEKLKVHVRKYDKSLPNFGIMDGKQKAFARSLCTGDFCWQQDSDEVLHENHFKDVREMITFFPKGVDLVCLPVVEFWGDQGKIRMDVNPWKWRLSVNSPQITHGIPVQLRWYKDGMLYSRQGSDGCDYIHAETGQPIAALNFYSGEVHEARMQALAGDLESQNQYRNWFAAVTSSIPTIYHYSWFDMKRKISLYRDYWTTHWQSLYGESIEDNASTNMFFDKPWSEVTDSDIEERAEQLQEQTCGWIFHRKFDPKTPNPEAQIEVSHPAVIQGYIGVEVE